MIEYRMNIKYLAAFAAFLYVKGYKMVELNLKNGQSVTVRQAIKDDAKIIIDF